MTGRPIDTAAMRKHANKSLVVFGCGEEFGTQRLMIMANDVVSLCDALDAARAERDRMRRLIVHAVKRVDEWNCPSDLHAAMLRALGEEKQR